MEALVRKDYSNELPPVVLQAGERLYLGDRGEQVGIIIGIVGNLPAGKTITLARGNGRTYILSGVSVGGAAVLYDEQFVRSEVLLWLFQDIWDGNYGKS